MEEALQQEHSRLVTRLKKDDHQMYHELMPGDCDTMHMLLGAMTELGELGTTIKAYLFYRKPIDHENLVEELGDVEFFLEGLRQRLRITREETLAHNINKLNRRYGSGSFSNEQAQARADKAEVGDFDKEAS